VAIVNVKPMWSPNTSDYDMDSRRVLRSYTVLSDDPDEPERIVLGASGVPRWGDALDAADQLMRCRGARIIGREGMFLWIVQVEFHLAVSSGNDPLGLEFDEPAEVSWDDEEVEIPLDKDLDNKPLVNAAGEPLEGVTGILTDMVLTVRRNEASFSAVAARSYKNKVNAESFLDFPAGECKIRKIAGRRRFSTSTQQFFWEVTYIISIRKDGWKRQYLNMGYYELDDDGKQQNITDDDDNPLAAPVMLLANGKQAPPGTPPVYVGPFRFHDSVSFAPLNLG
jgi:hypothetical protein